MLKEENIDRKKVTYQIEKFKARSRKDNKTDPAKSLFKIIFLYSRIEVG